MLEFINKILIKLRLKKQYTPPSIDSFTMSDTPPIQIDHVNFNKVSYGSTSKELTNYMYVKTVSAFVKSNILYSIDLPELIEGDILKIDAYTEASNELDYVVMVGHAVYLIDDKGKWLNIVRPRGTNITPEIHHQEFNAHGTLVCPYDIKNGILIYILEAASTLRKDVKDWVKLEPGYGELSYFLMRN